MASKDKKSDVKEAERKDRATLIKLTEPVLADCKAPLLIMFYPPQSSMREAHFELLHTALNAGGIRIAEPLPRLNVLIHTTGGEPIAAYRLAQVIRDFTKEVIFLVPEYAYSGGTLTCLSGDTIMLGNHAVLSPIDITQYTSSNRGAEDEHHKFHEEEERDTEVELVAIDHFIKVATQARIEIENEFRRRNWKSATSQVESSMLCKMVADMGVTEIAKLYREKNITHEYAKELLRCYMFRDSVPQSHMDRILRRLVVEAPSHEFAMDYHICKDLGLKVQEMTEELSDNCNELLKQMKKMAHEQLICEYVGGTPLPFFQLFPYNAGAQTEVTETGTLETYQEATNGNGKGDTVGKQRETINPKRRKDA